MPPEWEKDRYISLLGDPIGADGKPEKLRTSFYKAADVQAVGLSIALSALLTTALQQSLETVLFFSAVMVACNLSVLAEKGRNYEYERLMRSGFSRENIEEKCIDKKPDGRTALTLNRYGIPVEEAKRFYLIDFGMNFTFNIATTCLSPAFGAMWTLGCLGLYTREASGINRFNKVAKGDWVIVDRPAPKPVQEKKPALEWAGAFMTS
ncbi:MAG: hypothetical protein CO093_00500 [Alphaproteobacteria bacterium CG_4_9_14_3_um_filter_47_13]|nr:MAG: hypothetical protein CO093_00500 [Alphaproteobacteria bacterium CG_4_9_14_3_um_filter_47_13]